MCAGVCVASHDKSTLGNVAAGGGKSEVMALPPLVLAGCWLLAAYRRRGALAS
jgi:hypothetical protein